MRFWEVAYRKDYLQHWLEKKKWIAKTLKMQATQDTSAIRHEMHESM